MSESQQRERSATVYDFVHPGHRLNTEWPVLGQLHQRLVEGFSRRLAERFRMRLEAYAEPTRRMRYEDFVADVPAGTVINEIALAAEPGVLLFCLEAATVPALVDGWFGGTPIYRGESPALAKEALEGEDAEASGDGEGASDDGEGESIEPSAEERSPPPLVISSATERRALGHVLDAVTAAIGESWADITELAPSVGRATTRERLARGGYGDVVIDCGLQIRLGQEIMSARLVYPVALLEPFAAKLAREDHTHPVEDDRFRQSLGAGLMDCEIEVRGVLAESRITLRDLMAMKPGDFIPLKDMQNVSFRTDNTPLFDARVGNTNGRVSASLSRWHLPKRP